VKLAAPALFRKPRRELPALRAEVSSLKRSNMVFSKESTRL
jgi:hypothetical protein